MTRQYLGPYINFQGHAREAMEFYHSVLGGKLELHSADEKGARKAAGVADRIAHARLEADGAHIIGTDGHPDYPAKVGENMAVALGGTDEARLTKLFHDLAEGGKIKGPLTSRSGGPTEGFLEDKLGINWVVSIDKD
jgi:PhnB protein